MATYSSRLRLTLPATGEYVNSWGAVVNDGITSLVDDSISGTSAITIAGTDYTLTSVNGSSDESRRMFIVATGTPGAARNVICPAVTKLYSITNNTTGGFALTLKTSAGTGISVPNGATMLLKCDGTNVVQAASAFTDVTYTTTLTGGTGIVNLGSGQFYKDASGNVGVGGTPNAAAKLEVFGESRINPASGAAILRFMTAGTERGRFAVDTTSNMLFETAGSEKMRLDTSGNLLINTTSSALSNSNSTIFTPSGQAYWQHANGTASGSVYIGFAYNGGLIGSITQSGTAAVLYNLTSDQRLKTNIQDAAPASALIDAIQVRQFDWKSDGSHQRYGFVAQELVTVAPEAVHAPADPEAMMAVDYSKLVPMLIKEVQALRARVAALEAA